MIEKIQKLLTEGENIILDARIHPIVYAPPIFYLFLALLAALFFHWIVGVVIVIVTLYPAYTAYINYNMTHLVLTNKKVLSRAGWISRDWTRMAFERIENAYLEEPIIGRQFGYSTVVVSGVGSGSIAIPYVRNGDDFVKRLEQELERNRKENKG